MSDDIIQRTQSVCPVCLQRIDAAYVEQGEDVMLNKTCPQHGSFSARVWEGADSFKSWQQSNANQPPANPAMAVDKGCPYDCGLCAEHKQATCCVLFEVTRRCNMSCPICFASAGQGGARKDAPLEQIEGWYDMLLARGGPFNIQLSGGEPTMRDDLPDIIRMGRDKGFTFFQLNTNGLRLAGDMPYLQALADAGLNTVFLQFDGLSPRSSIALRGEDRVRQKIDAIKNCGSAGLGVVLVPTVKTGVNDSEMGELLDFAAENMPVVRGVHFQPMSYFGRHGDAPAADEHITIPRLLHALEKQTGGRVKAEDFMPGGAEHALCSFHADYKVADGVWQPQQSGGNSGCCCGQTSDAARDSVARKWSAPSCCEAEPDMPGYDTSALDEFLLDRKLRTLAISGMCFQDAWNLDLERLSRCYINVVDVERNCLVPFCSYNLTAADGRSLYRANYLSEAGSHG